MGVTINDGNDKRDTQDNFHGSSMDLTTSQAAEILGVTSRSIARYVAGGKLPARNRNLRDIVIRMDDLRKFAEDYNLMFNDQLAQELSQK